MSSDPTEIASTYFYRVRNRDIRVADLFHEDAKLIGLGPLYQGRAAIEDFYRGVIERAGPTPRIGGPLLANGDRVAAEIYIDFATGPTIHAVDIFVIEDGLIRSLTYFISEPLDEGAGASA